MHEEEVETGFSALAACTGHEEGSNEDALLDFLFEVNVRNIFANVIQGAQALKLFGTAIGEGTSDTFTKCHVRVVRDGLECWRVVYTTQQLK